MSKSQYGLTVNESKFWKNCMATLTGDKPLEAPVGESERTDSPGEQLESLVDRSSIMTTMYERRTNLPTKETYSQVRQILRALGIPCIKVVDAYEAEALASSMVLAGLADYVVSEDTVRASLSLLPTKCEMTVGRTCIRSAATQECDLTRPFPHGLWHGRSKDSSTIPGRVH
jgi:hypothetical protein